MAGDGFGARCSGPNGEGWAKTNLSLGFVSGSVSFVLLKMAGFSTEFFPAEISASPERDVVVSFIRHDFSMAGIGLRG
jgi:hypothetical protein